ncbi:hypothetical protein [Rhodococcus sp. 06-1460-1B]|uniref:hypothetical protein n=1 Tax=Rhodococcus sp. 06-1460-1B TaxID=2022501 RepID=UPI0020CB7608|nr:hypothetical protein [Rhodococcus sp. 06-1460-1B]
MLNSLVSQQRAGNYRESLRAKVHLKHWLESGQNSDRWVANFAGIWLPAMAQWKIGTPNYLISSWKNSVVNYREGRKSDEPPHEERFRLEWSATSAILLATVYADRGNRELEARFRKIAVGLYSRVSVDERICDPWLAWRSLSNRMLLEPESIKLDAAVLDEVQIRSEALSFQLLGDLADSVVRAMPIVSYSVVEQVWIQVDELMQRCGYGASGDLAESVGLRRRWWLLQCALGQSLDLDLLSWDIDYWDRVKLGSEIRLLRVDLQSIGAPSDVIHTVRR